MSNDSSRRDMWLESRRATLRKRSRCSRLVAEAPLMYLWVALAVTVVSPGAAGGDPARGSTPVSTEAAWSDPARGSAPVSTYPAVRGLQFSGPIGASGWATAEPTGFFRRDSGEAPASSSRLILETGSLNYQSSLRRSITYPTAGVRMVDGLHLSPALARLYGVRHVELGRGGTALKGVGLGGKIALLTGAMASSFGFVDDKTALWIASGVAAAGAIYGASAGYEQPSWRDEWRWPEERSETIP